MTNGNEVQIPTHRKVKYTVGLVVLLLPLSVMYFVAEETSSVRPKPYFPAASSIFKYSDDKPPPGDGCYDKLKQILLVVVYNYDNYDTIPMLERFYGLVFPKIVYCGPAKSTKFSVIDLPIERGFWGYECLGEAIRRHPGHRGYFYINDDSLINWWNLDGFDLNKVWTGIDDLRHKNIGSDMAKDEPSNDWYWWKGVDAFERCKKAFAQVEEVVKSKNKQQEYKIDEEALSVFFENTGGVRLAGESYSDVFYVPGHVSYLYANISNIFFKHKVFLEVSVPTIQRFLGHKKDFQPLNGFYLRQKYGSIPFHDGIHFWENYNSSRTFFHPIKLSKTLLNRNLVSDIVYRLGHEKLKNCKLLKRNTSG